MNKKILAITYIVSFILSWLLMIFWLKKNEFDIEFRRKETTMATVYNIGTDEVLDELYDERNATLHEIEYIEYFYFVDGKKLKSGSQVFGVDYSIKDKLNIEYVVINPVNTRIKGVGVNRNNFFVRNIIIVIPISIFVMIGINYVLGLFDR